MQLDILQPILNIHFALLRLLCAFAVSISILLRLFAVKVLISLDYLLN